jgi:hypothetical protein
LLLKLHLRTIFSLLVFFGLALSACGPGSILAASQTPTPALPAESTTTAPAAPSLQEYTNPEFGFSLSYPDGYEVQSSFSHTVVFLAPQSTPGHRERAILSVELTRDPNAEWYASHLYEENVGLGTEITSTVQVIDGQQAYILGRVPGQDLNRQVFIVDRGMLYHLMFMPDSPGEPEAYQQMETLYAAIINTLRFLPERRSVPPVTDMRNMLHLLQQALETRSQQDILSLLGDEFVLGNLNPTTPEGFTFSRHGRTDVVPLILQDQLPAAPAVSLQYQVDWASVPGSLDTYSGIFPGEDVTPILAKGWGPDGAGQAVLILARRMDGSLFWRGAFVLQQD